MNIKQTIFAVTALLLMASSASAQGVLGKLKDKAIKAGQKKVEQVVTQKAEKAVEGAVTQPSDEQPATTTDSPAKTTTEVTGSVGLPKNTDGPQPQENAKANASYTAIITYPSHSQEIYYDGVARRRYAVRTDRPTDRSLLIADSLIVYNIDDAKKTITVMSLQGANGAKTYKKINHKKEVVEYADRWCIYETYVAEEHDAMGQVMQTHFAIWTDIETGITLREDQNGGPEQEMSHITLGTNPDKAFDLPKGYKVARTIDAGRLMQDMEAAENSDDPAAAARKLRDNLDKYITKPKQK